MVKLSGRAVILWSKFFNLLKCLWLGALNGRTDSLVNIERLSVKIKVLGIVLSPGNMAVESVVNSWRHHYYFIKTNSAFSRDF